MASKSHVLKLSETSCEKEVENVWNKILGISDKIKYIKNSDGVWNERLFEYKFDAGFYTKGDWRHSSYKALAQAIYYLKRISKLTVSDVKSLPQLLIILDKNGGFVVPSQQVERIISDSEDGLVVDWLRPASSPDTCLVDWLESNKYFKHFGINYYEFATDQHVNEFKRSILEAEYEPAKIEIDEENFVGIYNMWKELFAGTEDNPRQIADNYVLDINLKFKFVGDTNILINLETDRRWEVPRQSYDDFWRYYKRPPSVVVQQYILAHKDCLYDTETRNDTGDFYTPIEVAKLSNRYIDKVVSIKEQVNALWWDPAAGGANLFIQSPRKENVILSTLEKPDYRTLKSITAFSSSTIERFNFLKDKLPESIDKQLKDTRKKPLMFLLNPPFNDQSGHSKGKGKNPNQVDETFIKPEDLEEVSLRSIRGAYVKFLYKINSIIEESERTNAYVGLFSKTAWMTGSDYKQFFEFWNKRYEFCNGFIVSSEVFKGTKGKWPVMFSLWKKRCDVLETAPSSQLKFDIFDKDLEKIGIKNYQTPSEDSVRLQDTINRDCLKKLAKNKFVPLKNEYQIYDSGKIYCSHLHEGAFGYLRTISNDIQNSGSGLILMSAPYGGSNSNGVSVTKDNFESALLVYGLRKSIPQEWHNDKDEFILSADLRKNSKFSQLQRKAVLWSILEGGYTSSLGKVIWDGSSYNVRNNFFAMPLSELSEVRGIDSSKLPSEDPYASIWIENNRKNFTLLEQECLNAYKNLMIYTFEDGLRKNGDVKRKVMMPDASPRQIINGIYRHSESMSSEDKKVLDTYLKLVKKLQDNIKSLVYKYEIISEAIFFQEDSGANSGVPPKKGGDILPFVPKTNFDKVLERRLALTSYIVAGLKDDPNLGRVKLAKIFYMCDLISSQDFKTKYLREANGPLDQGLIYNKKSGYEELSSKFQIFQTKKEKNGRVTRYRYIPDENFSAMVKRAKSLFDDDLASFDSILKIFKKLDVRQSEIVATLYACWNDLINKKVKNITDDMIVDEFKNNWHEDKKNSRKFPKGKLLLALEWMRKNNLVPIGKGEVVNPKPSRVIVPF